MTAITNCLRCGNCILEPTQIHAWTVSPIRCRLCNGEIVGAQDSGAEYAKPPSCCPVNRRLKGLWEKPIAEVSR